MFNLTLFAGIALGAAVIPLLVLLLRAVTVAVEDETAVLVTRFGKHTHTLRTPGLHFIPARIWPWVKTRHVSLRRDFRHFPDIHVNDARGTTVMVDLWLEFRLIEPDKALFGVADWDRSLQNLVTHAATAILGTREFAEILGQRLELSQLLEAELQIETARWGIRLERALISKLSLSPSVSRQIFESVAARLERARAAIEERGRLDVAELEAATSMQVARFVAEAKGQYPLAVGQALGALEPEVQRAYTELYELAQVRPHRTVAFRGFGKDDLGAADAAMLLIPPATDLPPSPLPPRPNSQAHSHHSPQSSNGSKR